MTLYDRLNIVLEFLSMLYEKDILSKEEYETISNRTIEKYKSL